MPFICQKLFIFGKFEVSFHVLTPLLVLTSDFNVSSNREIRKTVNVVKQAKVANVIPQARNRFNLMKKITEQAEFQKGNLNQQNNEEM